MIVTTRDQLVELVADYSRFDELVFDLETVYHPEPDEAAEAERLSAMTKAQRTPDEEAWLDNFKLKATDFNVNSVIWIGLATWGRSDAVATGHPLGAQLTPTRKEKTPAFELYGPDDERSYTKSGKPSYRAIEHTVPATFARAPEQLDITEALEILRPLFFDPNRRIINQNVKFDIKTLAKYYNGEFINGPYAETMVAQNLIDENLVIQYDLGSFVKAYFDHTYDKLGSKGVHNFSFEKAARYAEQDAKFTWMLWQRMKRSLHNQGLWDYFEFEMRVMEVMMRKEYYGVFVDTKAIRRLRKEFQDDADAIKRRLIAEYGLPPSFNFNSTQQKADLFYKKLRAKITKKTDSGAPSTDSESLEAIVAAGGKAGEVAQLFLDYADVQKTIGTYLVGMGAKLDRSGRLYTTFAQHATDTGRFSSYSPNVHNIPRNSELRNLFIPPSGYVVIGVDYDQVELRFICTWAKDPSMREVFLSGEDVHGTTAALVLNKPLSEVTSEERTNFGKMPNFLIGYGGSHFLLAAKTGIPNEQAEKVFDAYFRRFSRINPWKEEELRLAKSRAQWDTIDGQRRMVVPPYVETMLGRRRRLPHLFLNPRNAPSREQSKEMYSLLARAERQGINAIIQGSAAETIKLAMVDIQEYIDTEKFPMRMALNVHDEIMAYCDQRHAEEGLEIIEYHMANVLNPLTGEPPLSGWVPLVASGQISDRWMKG